MDEKELSNKILSGAALGIGCDARSDRLVGGGGGGYQTLNTAVNAGNGIGWAVKQLWNGGQVRRRGWNGRGMHLALQVPDMHSKMTLPYVYMRTADRQLVPWLCSQSDLLATDWELAEV